MDVHRAVKAPGQQRSKRRAHQALRFVVEMYKTAGTRGLTVRRRGVRVCCVARCAYVVAPLLPRMKASPYLALSCPFTYSSVCSIAMFMKPSRHARTPVPQHGKLSGCQWCGAARWHATSHTVAFPLRENSLALMVLTRATSGPVVVDGESFLDALFASAGQG